MAYNRFFFYRDSHINRSKICANRGLQPHQVSRIIAFTNPSYDPTGAGWNVIQAKTAIGSGGFSGKGFLQGTQIQLKFLPESYTDFIFYVIGEEFGFIGAGLLVLLFFFYLLNF